MNDDENNRGDLLSAVVLRLMLLLLWRGNVRACGKN